MEILELTDMSGTWMLVIGTLILLYIYGKRRNSIFKDAGIPGPEPVVFIGNLHQVMRMGVTFNNVYGKKYGKVYGLMMGGVPMATVTDPDILREILIKDFHNFTDRMVFDLDDFPLNKGVAFEGGATWKRLRHILSPTFSGAKLRMMCERINICAKTLTRNLLSAADKSQDILIKDYCGGYTMDVIASTAFSIESDSQNELDGQLMSEARQMFTKPVGSSLMFTLIFLFPGVTPLLKALGLSIYPKPSLKFLERVVSEMIKQRKAEDFQEKRADFLQLLIDAEEDGTLDDVINTNKPDMREYKKLTKDELLGQALTFFVAGYETTANTLHFAAYALATNPKVQQRLIEEIDSVLGNEDPDYDNIRKLVYLDHVISETLRMFPVSPSFARKAMDTVTIKGYTFPKGLNIIIPMLMMHRDPDVFPDPHRFYPERWDEMSEMDPMCFQAFGHGPRHCIGMRLAQLEMKIALVQILKKIRFVPAADTPAVLEEKDMTVVNMLGTKKPIKLQVKAR